MIVVVLLLLIFFIFLVMRVFNYILDGMILLVLVLVMGNLVDDVICMIENIE